MAADEKVLKESDIAYDSVLDLFGIPISNLGISESQIVSYKPSNAFDLEGNVKWRIPGTGGSYVDLREIYVKTSVRIMQSDGKPVPPKPKKSATKTTTSTPADGQPPPTAPSKETSAEEEETAGKWRVSPVAYLAHSLWDGVEVRFNDYVVHGGQTGYSYRAVLNTLLGNNEISDEELQCGMFIKDSPGYVSEVDVSTTSNQGLLDRHKLMENSKTVELVSKIDIDCLKTDRLLLNGTSIDLTLTPTSSAFRLLTPNTTNLNYVLEIVDISLEVKLVTPSSQVMVAHQNVLQKGLSRAKYFYMKEDLRKFNLAKGSSVFHSEDTFNGRIPEDLTIIFLPSDSLNGKFQKNPYEFKHYKLSHLNVSLSGRPTPEGPLSFDFDNGKYMKGYMNLYKGKGPPSNSQRITLKEYAGGFSIFRVLLNTQNESDQYPSNRSGSLRLEARFAEPLPENVVMLAHISFPAMYEIDFSRSVYV